jgi:hypothetical protein
MDTGRSYHADNDHADVGEQIHPLAGAYQQTRNFLSFPYLRKQQEEQFGQHASLYRWIALNKFYFKTKANLASHIDANPSCGLRPDPTYLSLSKFIVALPEPGAEANEGEEAGDNGTGSRDNEYDEGATRSPDYVSEFMNLYAQCIPYNDDYTHSANYQGPIYDETKPGLYMSECRTKVFNMFFDIDVITEGNIMEPALIEKMLGTLQKAVADLYINIQSLRDAEHTANGASGPERMKILSKLLSMLVLDNHAKTYKCDATTNNLQQYKVGYHVHFPYMEVTTEDAMLIRLYVVYALSRDAEFDKLAPTSPENGGPKRRNWLKDIDINVYAGAGCRMPHSWKVEKCLCSPSEKDPVTNTCRTCLGFGIYSEPRGYRCFGFYKYDDKASKQLETPQRKPTKDYRTTDTLIKDDLLLLVMASIRSSSSIPANAPPRLPPTLSKNEMEQTLLNHFDLPQDDTSVLYAMPKQSRSMMTRKLQDPRYQQGAGRAQQDDEFESVLVSLDPTDKIYQLIARTIPKLDGFKAIHPKISRISYYTNSQGSGGGAQQAQLPSVYLCVDSVGVCLKNGGLAHKSQTTYFTFSPTGVRQKCFCRCPNKPCKDYVSDPECYVTSSVMERGQVTESVVNMFDENSDVMKIIFPHELQRKARERQQETIGRDLVQYDRDDDGILRMHSIPAERTQDLVRYEFSMGACSHLYGATSLSIILTHEDIKKKALERAERLRQRAQRSAKTALTGTVRHDRNSLRNIPAVRELDKISGMCDAIAQYGAQNYDDKRKQKYREVSMSARGRGRGRGR